MTATEKHYAKGQKPDTKENILHVFVYIMFLEKLSLYRQKLDQQLPGAGSRSRTDCKWAQRNPLGRWKYSKIVLWWWLHI